MSQVHSLTAPPLRKWRGDRATEREGLHEGGKWQHEGYGQLGGSWHPFQPRWVSECGGSHRLTKDSCKAIPSGGKPPGLCQTVSKPIWVARFAVMFRCWEFVFKGKVGESREVGMEEWVPKKQSNALEDRKPEDLALCTDDKDERSGNGQPTWVQVDTCFTTHAGSAAAQAPGGSGGSKAC